MATATIRRFRMIIPRFPNFNVYSHIARKITALGPLCVATAANQLAGWEVEVIDENNYRSRGPVDRDGAPDHRLLQLLRPADVVGFYGGLSSTVPRLYQIATFYRSLGVLTVAGGHHFLGQASEGLAAGLDIIVHGEGEYAIQEILRQHADRQRWHAISGISFLAAGSEVHTPPRAPIADLDALPFPDFDLLRYAKVSVFPVGRTRGCGMHCEFCAVKDTPRWAAPEYLFRSIVRIIERYGWKDFFVVDDLFTQDRASTKELCRLLIAYQEAVGKRLDLTVQIRLDVAKDPEMLDLLRRAGVLTVAIGYESPIDEELQAMGKHIRAQDMLALTEAIHRAGLLIHGMFIFGYPAPPGMTFNMPLEERVRRFKRFVRRVKIDTIQILLPVPLPGTALRERLAAANRIYPLDSLGWEYYDGNFPLFEPEPPITAAGLQNGIRSIMGTFYHFSHMWLVGLRTLWFPFAFLPLIHFREKWDRWYRGWRNNIRGFGGWIVLKHWTAMLKKDNFLQKLAQAQQRLHGPPRNG